MLLRRCRCAATAPIPRSYLLCAGSASQTGQLVADAPVEVVAAQMVARRLDALTSRSQPISSLAAASGVSRATVHNILSGRRMPDFSTLIRLQMVLHVAIVPGADDLLT